MARVAEKYWFPAFQPRCFLNTALRSPMPWLSSPRHPNVWQLCEGMLDCWGGNFRIGCAFCNTAFPSRLYIFPLAVFSAQIYSLPSPPPHDRPPSRLSLDTISLLPNADVCSPCPMPLLYLALTRSEQFSYHLRLPALPPLQRGPPKATTRSLGHFCVPCWVVAFLNPEWMA